MSKTAATKAALTPEVSPATGKLATAQTCPTCAATAMITRLAHQLLRAVDEFRFIHNHPTNCLAENSQDAMDSGNETKEPMKEATNA